jgi:CheY-like chemotaxis protein
MDPLLLKDLRVLVIDDNEINRRILRAMLENWGMLATIVASGPGGIEEMLGSMHSGRPFSLVLLDGMMPEMDGFTVAEKIREDGELSSAVIMMRSDYWTEWPHSRARHQWARGCGSCQQGGIRSDLHGCADARDGRL